jgi:hypothetical protein
MPDLAWVIAQVVHLLMDGLPAEFLDLPFGRNSWPPDVQNAHSILSEAYRHARQLTELEDPDPLRVAFHINKISTDVIHVLEALESYNDDTRTLPSAWLHDAAILLGELVKKLRASQQMSGLRWFFIRATILWCVL